MTSGADTVVLARVVVLAGCNGPSGIGPPTNPWTAPATTSTSTPERRLTTTATPRADPSHSIEAASDDRHIHVTIYSSTFISGPSILLGSLSDGRR